VTPAPFAAWHSEPMAWEEELFALFDDLEQQAESLYDLEREAELADRSRSAYHEVTLASRLMASAGSEVAVDVHGVGPITGTVERVGAGWLLLRGSAQDWIVPLPAVQVLHGASARSVPELAWSPVARLGLGSALRRLAEVAGRCVLHLVDGTRHEAVLVRVGADFVEARVAGGRTVLVALAGLAAVQSRDDDLA
jgi:hypothetical protein